MYLGIFIWEYNIGPAAIYDGTLEVHNVIWTAMLNWVSKFHLDVWEGFIAL